MVGKFVQSDFTTQDSATYKAAIDADISVIARTAAMYAPHAQTTPNMTILVDAGAFPYNSTIVTNAQQSTGTITAPVSNPRIDLVVINAATGVVSVITGTEAVSPSVPALTSGKKLPIAQIALAVGQTSIANANITDVRVSMAGSAPIDPAAATPGLRTLGTGTQQACPGDDARLSDTRTPTDGTVTAGKVSAGAITETKVGSSAVSQAKLKTTYGEIYVRHGTAGNYTLPGGEYGFYPQIRSFATSVIEARIASTGAIGSSYVTNIYIDGTNNDAYVKQRYVTSSGEVFWIFIMRDAATKAINGIFAAPDHPCFGNGGNPATMPHPFLRIDLTGKEVICVNPSEEELTEMRAKITSGKSFIQIIKEDYEVDESSTPIWPTEEVTVGLPEGYDWQYSEAEGRVTPIKMVIPQPASVICKALKLKTT